MIFNTLSLAYLAIILGIILDIFFLKFSSEKAYKRKTTWSESFHQWLWLLGLRIILALFLSMISFMVMLI